MKSRLPRISSLVRYAHKLGWLTTIKLSIYDIIQYLGFKLPVYTRLKIKNFKYSVLMRNGTSDRKVLSQIFVYEEYSPITLSNPRNIIDLGANAGYSSAYFLSRYPNAKVLAVEPDLGNYDICCRNLQSYGQRAKVIQGAAWSTCTSLMLDKGNYGDGGCWAIQVKPMTKSDPEGGSHYVTGYDVTALADLCDAAEIDLLKIDIERSELVLFSQNTEKWLPRVNNLCIELHGADCEAVFFRALEKYSYNLTRSGELTVCRDLRFNPKIQSGSENRAPLPG